MTLHLKFILQLTITWFYECTIFIFTVVNVYDYVIVGGGGVLVGNIW